MHSLFIFNPVSGKKDGRNEKIGNYIQRLTQNGDTLEVYQTQGKGDAHRFLMECTKEYDRLVCCGGDGTLHEVINGVLDSKRDIPIGYIPMGSTNDYAKNLGINRKTALKCLEDGDMSAIDIGSMNGEYFNYVAAFGNFIGVPFHTPQQLKNSWGYFAYLMEGIKQLGELSPKHIRFCVDGEWHESDVIVGMITNTFSVAGVKNFKRQMVQLDDGKMEYLFIKYPKNLVEFQTILSLLLSEKIDERYMNYGQFSSMEMEMEGMEWTLDGEDGGIHDHVSLQIHAGAVNVIHKK